MSFVARLSLVLAFCAVALPASAADQPTLLGVSRDWTAYSAQTADGKVCYALSRPIAVSPRKAARDPIFVLVSTWPNRHVKDEVQIVPGYPYRDGEPVYAQVGRTRTEFFTRNNGSDGSAWVKDLDNEAALVRAMRGGNRMTVTGMSSRGTRTADTYSLSGVSAALERAHRACE